MSIELSFARLKEMIERNYFELEVKQNRWFHAYLLVGKNKDSADELVKFIIQHKECLAADISEISPEAESGKQGEIKIEQIRELLHTVSLSPLGKCRIAVIYHSERLNRFSGNVLLKTLEEPAGDVTFILVAENNSVLPTIRSRCRVIQIRDDLFASKSEEKYTKILNMNFAKASKEIEKIVKNNEIGSFLDELENCYREKMLVQKKSALVKAIDRIEEIKKEIANNANQRLALECLYLTLKSIQ